MSVEKIQKNESQLALDLLNSQMLTTKEASNYLNLSIRYVRRLASEGKITSYKPGGKNLYFDVEDLDGYLRRFKRMNEEELNTYSINRFFNNRQIF